jgi:SAM-dependent methyltransferase
MIQYLKRIHQRQNFFPSALGLFVNPFYFARKGLYHAIYDLSGNLGGKLLDVGCGTKPYKNLFDVSDYVGLDIDSEDTRKRGIADFLYDGQQFPFSNHEFDSLVCNQVLEHVFNPDQFFAEINRVLKPGGMVLLTVPFVWDEHEQPFDYARYSTFGLYDLLEKNGFEVIEHCKLNADATVLFQMMNAYLYKVKPKMQWIVNLLFTVTVMGSVNIIGLLFKYIMPSNQDLFLNHAVLARKKDDRL